MLGPAHQQHHFVAVQVLGGDKDGGQTSQHGHQQPAQHQGVAPGGVGGQAGVAQADIDRIDGPVGLPIGAVGPSEIALSIAAATVRAFHDNG